MRDGTDIQKAREKNHTFSLTIQRTALVYLAVMVAKRGILSSQRFETIIYFRDHPLEKSKQFGSFVEPQ